jgi:hypothetical protein
MKVDLFPEKAPPGQTYRKQNSQKATPLSAAGPSLPSDAFAATEASP